jgi:hypothetical protein
VIWHFLHLLYYSHPAWFLFPSLFAFSFRCRLGLCYSTNSSYIDLDGSEREGAVSTERRNDITSKIFLR